MKKYKANYSNNSSNGIIGGIQGNNLKKITKEIKEIAKGNGGGIWWVQSSNGQIIKSGKI